MHRVVNQSAVIVDRLQIEPSADSPTISNLEEDHATEVMGGEVTSCPPHLPFGPCSVASDRAPHYLDVEIGHELEDLLPVAPHLSATLGVPCDHFAQPTSVEASASSARCSGGSAHNAGLHTRT